ncbi:MAG: SHOCT domain-containing protein [Euryarchaeota archaeon]|nr:SHOCT domain-containing protein [Euryarchaeota archaeon]
MSEKDLTVILIGIFLIFLVVISLGMFIGSTMGPGMMGYGWGFGWMGFGMIFWILIIVLILYFLFRRMEEPIRSEKERALNILKERYAKGEITKEQYLEMKKEIEK